MMESRVLGLWGLSGSGKSLIAEALEQRAWVRVNLAHLIADFVLEGEGFGDVFSAARNYDFLKREIPGFHQKLVTYGQAVERFAGPGTWAGALKVQIEDHLGQDWPVVWENVRTVPDYRALRALGGKLVRVTRPETSAFSPLDTEIADDSVYTANYHFINDGPKAEVPSRVDRMLGVLT